MSDTPAAHRDRKRAGGALAAVRVPAGLDRPTWVRTEDVRAVSDRRLQGQRPLGSVTDSDLMTVKRFLRLMLDL